MSQSAKQFRVVLLIETANEYGRGILRGITRYAKLRGNWEFLLKPSGIGPVSIDIERREITGIIARPENVMIEKWVSDLDLPIILIDPSESQTTTGHPFSAFPYIRSSSEAIARMAASHLISQGYNHYAFYGNRKQYWSKIRCETFCSVIGDIGFNTYIYDQYEEDIYGTPRQKSQAELEQWLMALPRPVGIMACNDEWGRKILAACWNQGIRVPDEIAVIGVDNDSLLCELSIPALTSIAVDTERAGYAGAVLLERLMTDGGEGGDRDGEVVPVEPVRIATRGSTRPVSFSDSDVNEVVAYIRKNIRQPISIKEIVRFVATSRRSLEQRFRNETGLTLNEMIRNMKLAKVKEYLLETDLTVEQVATETGFSSGNYLVRLFRKETGITPGEFRKNSPPGTIGAIHLKNT